MNIKNNKKLGMYFSIFVLCIIFIHPVLKYSLNDTDQLVINIILFLSVVMGGAIISFGVFGILLQVIYRIRYKKYERIDITKNYLKQSFVLILYFVLIPVFNYLNVESTGLITLSILIPFSLFKYCYKSNEYIIRYDKKLMFLRNNYTFYELQHIHKDKNSYNLICLNENNKAETVVYEFQYLVKNKLMDKMNTITNLLEVEDE